MTKLCVTKLCVMEEVEEAEEEDPAAEAAGHTDAFTQRKCLHTEALTHRNFYTQKLLHTDTFTGRNFYTQTLCSKASTQKLLYTEACTQTVLHTEAFTHRREGCRRGCLIAKHFQFLTLEPHFVPKGGHFSGASSALPAALKEKKQQKRRRTVTGQETQREREKM